MIILKLKGLVTGILYGKFPKYWKKFNKELCFIKNNCDQDQNTQNCHKGLSNQWSSFVFSQI